MTDDELVELYIRKRDEDAADKAEYEARSAQRKTLMQKIEALVLARLDERGASSTKCGAGTAFIETSDSASVADASEFLDFVIANEAWDLIEKRCAKLAVREFLSATNALPPGVNYFTRRSVSFRRAAAK